MPREHGGVAVPKPEPKRREKARGKRAEKAIEKIVRAACVARDGYCRVANVGSMYLRFGACDGPSQWCHLGHLKRFKTRGMSPEERHSTAFTCQMCATHHYEYDIAHTLEIDFLTEQGADSTLRIVKDGVAVLSIPKGTA